MTIAAGLEEPDLVEVGGPYYRSTTSRRAVQGRSPWPGPIRPEIRRALRKGMEEFERPDGVWAPASTWVVTARAPEEGSS